MRSTQPVATNRRCRDPDRTQIAARSTQPIGDQPTLPRCRSNSDHRTLHPAGGDQPTLPRSRSNSDHHALHPAGGDQPTLPRSRSNSDHRTLHPAGGDQPTSPRSRSNSDHRTLHPAGGDQPTLPRSRSNSDHRTLHPARWRPTNAAAIPIELRSPHAPPSPVATNQRRRDPDRTQITARSTQPVGDQPTPPRSRSNSDHRTLHPAGTSPTDRPCRWGRRRPVTSRRRHGDHDLRSDRRALHPAGGDQPIDGVDEVVIGR